MTEMDHANELLARIHSDKIRQIPLWRVRMRTLGRFALFGATVALGSVSVALAVQEIHAHQGRGWLLRRAMSDAAPYVWTLTAALMVWAGIRLFRELPRGWRVRPWMVGVPIAIFCLGAGVAIERSDALLGMHRMVARQIPSYREAWMRKALVSWHAPAEGRISGAWASYTDSAKVLLGVDGVRWTVRWEGEGALPQSPSIRLMGRVCEPEVFCATDWRPAPGFRNHFSQR
jgi:hypothetical protein